MNKLSRISAALALASASLAGTAQAAELGGSLSSMKRQHQVAVQLDYTFLKTPSQVRDFAAKGRLEMLDGNADYELSKVSFPYARREVRLFVELLAADYRAATGSRLVVTSLTRPEAAQPRNAHQLSVHPAGMAVDFRIPEDAAGREWLEKTLLSMEKRRLLDVTRERYPPHYHVAVFAKPYLAYAERRIAEAVVAAAIKPGAALAVAGAFAGPSAERSAPARLAMPIHPIAGGAASGFLALALFSLGGVIARRRKAAG